jgi:hypothetical protein
MINQIIGILKKLKYPKTSNILKINCFISPNLTISTSRYKIFSLMIYRLKFQTIQSLILIICHEFMVKILNKSMILHQTLKILSSMETLSFLINQKLMEFLLKQ